MRILVTGGAGYIGAITTQELLKKGFEVVVFDNLSVGHREAAGNTPFYQGDLLNKKDLKMVFEQNKLEAVIHFAALALAPESMVKPYEYFKNNILGGLNLLETMNDFFCKKIIFSSTCAVYGTPQKLPVTEDTPLHPESVYGESKLAFERILYWYDQIYKIKYISLRYFNAAGATLDGKLGEDHRPETHIIPLAIEAAVSQEQFTLYGDTYPTLDGTCVRDYIHVLDLAEAHILALEYLEKKSASKIFNLGAERGYSNKEVLEMVKKVTGVDFKVKVGQKREGDPAEIFADSSKIKREFGWQPKYSDLATIVETAWKWHRTHPKGYK
ncbi:UDP-glucose 4-epimerase GalE [Candidatus Gottesmanbacteria bacterium]|nr:UDP-glucose 4-epimerase GalE [Candidatus Gottesmanbacteria bacterium]MBI5465054.1 UDP-glucose 4-epimerase GalE [Candidatus Gottesmanbacteria bacterium]